MATYNIMLRMRKDKRSKKKGIPIYIRIQANGDVGWKTTGKYVDNEDQWDEENKKVKNHPDAKLLNAALKAKMEPYTKNGLVTELQEKAVTVQAIKGKKVKSFYEYGRSVRGNNPKTNVIINRTTAYWGREPKLSEITVEWLRNMENCFRTGYKDGKPQFYTLKGPRFGKLKAYGAETIANHMKWFRRVMNQAEAEEYIKKSPFGKGRYQVPEGSQPERDFLTKEEREKMLEAMHNNTFIHPITHRVLVYFLLGCYASYRISDWYKFDPAKNVKGNMLILRTTKTGKDVYYPNGKTTQSIIEHIKIVGRLTHTRNTVRKHLIIIAEALGIKKRIHTHLARHGFGCLMPEMKISKDDCAYYMGIGINMVEIYYHYTGEARAENTKQLMEV